MSGEDYATIREILAPYIGAKVVDITQHDPEDFEKDGRCFVVLMFDNGMTLKFFVGDDGFVHDNGEDGEDEEK